MTERKIVLKDEKFLRITCGGKEADSAKMKETQLGTDIRKFLAPYEEFLLSRYTPTAEQDKKTAYTFFRGKPYTYSPDFRQEPEGHIAWSHEIDITRPDNTYHFASRFTRVSPTERKLTLLKMEIKNPKTHEENKKKKTISPHPKIGILFSEEEQIDRMWLNWKEGGERLIAVADTPLTGIIREVDNLPTSGGNTQQKIQFGFGATPSIYLSSTHVTPGSTGGFGGSISYSPRRYDTKNKLYIYDAGKGTFGSIPQDEFPTLIQNVFDLMPFART